MDYIYNGELQIYQDNLDGFLAIAHRFKLEGLITDNGQDVLNQYVQTSNQEVKNEIFARDFDNSKQSKKSQKSSMANMDEKYSATENVIVKMSGEESGLNASQVLIPNDISPLQNVAQYVEKTIDNKFKCIMCGKVSNTKQNSQYHIETHLEGIVYDCQTCRKSFRSRRSFVAHKCSIC